MTPAAAPDHLLRATRERESRTTAQIQNAINSLRHQGLPLTVAAVSRAANVSRTSIYARPELLQQLKTAATRTARATGPQQPATAEARNLKRRLEASQARNRTLTAENQRLRDELAHALGRLRKPAAGQHRNTQSRSTSR